MCTISFVNDNRIFERNVSWIFKLEANLARLPNLIYVVENLGTEVPRYIMLYSCSVKQKFLGKHVFSSGPFLVSFSYFSSCQHRVSTINVQLELLTSIYEPESSSGDASTHSVNFVYKGWRSPVTSGERLHESYEFGYSEGDLFSPLPFIIKNGEANNTDHRETLQQYTTSLPYSWDVEW